MPKQVCATNFSKGIAVGKPMATDGCKSFTRGVVPEALASDKLVIGDDSSEGSQTAKSGTDGQKRHMRLSMVG